MPKQHPYTKEELVFRKRARAHSRYLKQKERAKFVRLQERIHTRIGFAVLAGKVITSWSVQDELALLARYSYHCAFCDQQKDELDLTYKDPDGDFHIDNMLPICYTCLVDRQTESLYPDQIAINIAIKDLPEGYNKMRLQMQSPFDQVTVFVVARLRKNDFEALIGWPGITPALVVQFGERLFESEARALFPQYKSLAYYSV